MSFEKIGNTLKAGVAAATLLTGALGLEACGPNDEGTRYDTRDMERAISGHGETRGHYIVPPGLRKKPADRQVMNEINPTLDACADAGCE